MTLRNFLKAALREDVGTGDVTSDLLVPAKAKGKAIIIAKEPGVFAGAEVVKELFRVAGSKVSIKFRVRDGQKFVSNQMLIELNGNVRIILKVERTLLNLLQHLCGIATTTREFVKRAGKVRILDTRKTTPLWRALEKEAVKCGGGHNHRMGLYDAIFVKENHRKYGDLRKLIRFRRQVTLSGLGRKSNLSPKAGFEIEVRNLRELSEALMLRPHVILFDNFKPAALKHAVQFVRRRTNSKIILEASGGVTLQNIAAYARTGVDQISIGALTHSVKAIDLSLLVE